MRPRVPGPGEITGNRPGGGGSDALSAPLATGLRFGSEGGELDENARPAFPSDLDGASPCRPWIRTHLGLGSAACPASENDRPRDRSRDIRRGRDRSRSLRVATRAGPRPRGGAEHCSAGARRRPTGGSPPGVQGRRADGPGGHTSRTGGPAPGQGGTASLTGGRPEEAARGSRLGVVRSRGHPRRHPPAGGCRRAWASVDIQECRNGYARVYAHLRGMPGEAEQVFLRDVDGSWQVITSGTGITCSDQDISPELKDACGALGLD